MIESLPPEEQAPHAAGEERVGQIPSQQAPHAEGEQSAGRIPSEQARHADGDQTPGHPLGRYMRVLRPLFGGVVLVFVVLAAYRLHGRWQGGGVSIRWLPLLLSSAPLVASAVWLAWAWKRLLEHIVGKKLPTGATIALNLESQLARYMPGKLGVPAIRMAGAPRLGLGMRTVGASLLVELAAFIAVGTMVALAWLLFAGHEVMRFAPWFGTGAWALVASVTSGALALTLVDRKHLPQALLRKLGVEGEGTLVPFSVVLSHVGYWVCWGLHGYLVVLAVGAEHDVAIRSSGLFIAAPILGFLALVTPGGVGVREAVISMGMMPVVGSATALTAAGISRGVSLAMDIAVWLGSRPWRNPPSQ